MASFSALDSIEKLGEELECSICMQRFQNARFLECLHTFCELCLQSCATRETENIITCPVCRNVTLLPNRGVAGLKPNPIVNRITEALNRFEIHESKLAKTVISCDACGASESVSNWYCRECSNFLCDFCKEAHIRMKNQFKDHQIVPVQDVRNHKLPIDWYRDGRVSQTPECDNHPGESLKFYCHMCKVRVCRDCIVLDHRDHECTTLQKVVKSMKTEMEGLLAMCNQKQLMDESAARALDDRRSESNRAIDILRLAVRNSATIAVDMVKRQEDDLLQKLDAVQNKVVGLYDESRENHQRVSESIDTARNVVTKMLLNGNDDDLAALHEGLVKTMTDTLNKEVDTKKDLTEAVNHIRFKSGFEDDVAPLAITVGRLTIPCIWINTEKIGVKSSALVAFLSDGSLVSCRLAGGIEIISCNPDQPFEKIKYNQPITDLAILNDDTICLLDRKNVIRSIPKGKANPSRQLGRYSGKGICISTCSTKDLEQIVVFQPRKAPYFSRLMWLTTDGDEFASFEVGDFTPDDMITTNASNMAFLSREDKSVLITDQTGTVTHTITKEGWVFTAFSNDPSSDYMFLASMPDDPNADKNTPNRVTIAKYSILDGRLAEDIVQDLVVEEAVREMSLANYKEEKIALSCGKEVFIFESMISRECQMLSSLI